MASGIFSTRNINQLRTLGGLPGVAPSIVEYLVVAGGGGAGGAGGGAGGLLNGIATVAKGTSYTVTVGGGGTGGVNESTSPATSGSSSVFGSISSTGGGKGGTWYSSSQNAVALGATGGSGGGSAGQYSYSSSVIGGQGTGGQGNAGGSVIGSTGTPYYQAGGGGAGTVGLNANPASYAGNGGVGVALDISGTRTAYAGGGGGGRASGGTDTTTGKGGAGGGGDAGTTASSSGTNGGTNTGGGGGGTNGAATGGNGGSGVVIVSYSDLYANAVSQTNATYSTSGSGSLLFNGSSSYIGLGGQSNFAFGTGDFTIEMWFYVVGGSGTNTNLYDSTPNGGGVVAPQIYIIGSPWTLRLYGGSAGPLLDSNFTVSTSTWYHLAITRSGTSTKIFVNGTQQGSTLTDTNNYTNGASRPVIGTWGSGSGNWFNGNITNLRVVKGTALYTSNFTVPTVPLTAVTNTQLLMSAVSGAQFADSSINGFVPTATGSPTWNQLSPFATGLGYKNRVYTWNSSGTITF